MRDDAAMDEDEERNVGDEVQEVHHASHLPVELGQHLQYTCTLHQQVHSNFATACSTRAVSIATQRTNFACTLSVEHKLRHYPWYTYTFHGNTKVKTSPLPAEYVHFHKGQTSPYIHFSPATKLTNFDTACRIRVLSTATQSTNRDTVCRIRALNSAARQRTNPDTG